MERRRGVENSCCCPRGAGSVPKVQMKGHKHLTSVPGDLVIFFSYSLTLTASQLYIVFKSLCIFKSFSSNLGFFLHRATGAWGRKRGRMLLLAEWTKGPHTGVRFLPEIQKQRTKKRVLGKYRQKSKPYSFTLMFKAGRAKRTHKTTTGCVRPPEMCENIPKI